YTSIALANGSNSSTSSFSPDDTKVLYTCSSNCGTSSLHIIGVDGTGDAAAPSGVNGANDWGSLTAPLPSLPLGQTFGSELATNPGDDNTVNASTGSYSTVVTDMW